MTQDKKVKKNVTFMLVPLILGENSRPSERKPAVFVEPSPKQQNASTKRRTNRDHQQRKTDCSASTEAPRRPANTRTVKKVPEQGKVRAKEPERKKPMTLQEVIRRVKNLFNGLTPETLQHSTAKLKELPLDTEESLKAVIGLIFEGAILRPNSSPLFASICHCLSKARQPGPTTADPTPTVSFQTLLIRHCQAEFERNHGRSDSAEKTQIGQDDAKAPCRSVNTIKLIGELFKIKILSAAAIHSCIKKLLKNRDEESLECLCELLSKDLEVVTSKREMDIYFNMMNNIIEEGKISTKISQKLKETVDLRQRNWLPEIHEFDDTDESQPSAVQPPVAPTGTSMNKYAALVSTTQPQFTANKKSQPARSSNSQLQQKKKEPVSNVKPSLAEEDMETFSDAVIEKYLEGNNLEETLQYVQQHSSPSVLHVFVTCAVDFTLQCSSDARKRMGLLLGEMHKSGVLPAEQIFKGLHDILQVADYMAPYAPDIWLHLAELFSPMVHKGGNFMADLCRQFRTLVPPQQVTVLLANIMSLLPDSNSSASTPR